MLTINYPLQAAYFFILISSSIEASNIDTIYPIIIKNTADGPDSFFGTTVTLVKDNNKSPGIIVGAPRANSTSPSHKGIHEPGVVWQCSFDRTTEACRVIVMDPTGNVPDPIRVNVTDKKDDGWLGGAIAQDSEHFISCGSRWTNQHHMQEKNLYYMNGICYWRPKKDIFENNLPPLSRDSRLLPILLEPAGQGKGRNNTGLAQVGFSIHIPSTGKNEMIIGAPGLNAWKGSVIRYSKDNYENPFGNLLLINSQKSSEFLQNNSYFGFAVSSGKFLKKDDKTLVQYVAGAPRGKNLAGQVIVFRFPGTGDDKLEKLYELDGTQIGSYFGSAICVADVNGDGFDDLIVGAPKYSADHRIVRKMGPISEKRAFTGRLFGSGDEGAVYVYLSTTTAFVPQQSGALNGRNQAWSQFGTAITNLGDINADGYADIAVGAPYEKDGAGAVYIYNGGKNGLSKKYSQIIQASNLNLNLKAFGFSFSEGVDIDNNGFNDLAIGAYDSSQVVILRSRPFIIVRTEVKSEIKRLEFDTKSFEVESCVYYIGVNAPDSMEVNVRIMSDVLSRPQRVVLQLPEQANEEVEHTYQEEMNKGVETCTKFKAVVIRPLESSGKPVVIKQEISIIEEGQQIGTGTSYEITRSDDGQVSTTISGPGFDKFCKTCPILDKTRSTFKELQLPLAVRCGDDDTCVSDLKLDIGFKEITPDANYIIGSSPVLTMEVKVTNIRETAISPAIIISWKQRNLKKIPSECQLQLKNETFTSYKCTLGKFLEEGKSVTRFFEFEMGDLVAGALKELWFEIDATTASDLLNPPKKTIVLPLIIMTDVEITGINSTRNFNPATLIPHINFVQDFEITLEGPSRISGIEIEFKIPTSFSTPSSGTIDVKVYQPQQIITQGSMRCYEISGSFASSRSISVKDISAKKIVIESTTEESYLTQINEFPLDDKDKLEEAGLNKLFGIGSGGPELEITCNSSSVECMNVRCITETFSSDTRATVTFPISISSISLRSLFSRNKLGSLKLVSEGKVKIMGIEDDIQLISIKPDESVAATIIQLESTQEVSKWIILVSVVAGLLLLACVVFCLYGAGCFDRKKKVLEEEEDDSIPESIPLKESTPFNSDHMDDDHLQSEVDDYEEVHRQ